MHAFGLARPRARTDAPAAPRRARPPVLFLIVYGACLVLVGVTASAQAAVVSGSFQQSAMTSVVQNDAALVRAVVNSAVKVGDIGAEGPTPARVAELRSLLAALLERAGMVRVELRGADGHLVAADVELAAQAAATGVVPGEALAGRPSATLVTSATAGQAGPPLGEPVLIREDLPLVTRDGGVGAVMTVWRDAGPILARVDDARREVVVLTLTAALILAGVLTFVFRTAQARISRQTVALVEASRRDPTTGLLNHGAIVEALGSAMDAARRAGSPIAVAIVDIDGFTLLNDTLGHAMGDEVLQLVTRELAGSVPTPARLGRYGPDEILVFAAGRSDNLVPALGAARTGLAGHALRHGDAEPLPVTISAGLADCPEDATSVTELLALAARTLASAKASGGDAVRTTRTEADAAETRAFDVFQGLIIAIDTKDRYTKRHSEDVARYALFIAERLGLDADMRRAVGVAGLLHDVGKIGIPDQILRKPGRLTEAEFRIVRQHVALGDMIVRDLPDIDLVRAGIRHHHERWDGAGYLHGTAGTQIPLIARILAVGDAFSAMTTTRPYRKAISTHEAIIRLLDASGSQLDEDLVTLFVEGLERDPRAPLPGSPAAGLWTPRLLGSGEAAA